jgi:hypothetical protein
MEEDGCGCGGSARPEQLEEEFRSGAWEGSLSNRPGTTQRVAQTSCRCTRRKVPVRDVETFRGVRGEA